MASVQVFRAAGNSPKRCALILGWTGGSLRHVAKHSVIWEKLGVNGVVADITVQETFLPRDRTDLRNKVGRLLDASITELQAKEVVVHMFSNGGCMLFLTLLEELEKRRRREPSIEQPPSIVGTIYDSCPSPMVHPLAGPIITLSTGLSMKQKASAMIDLLPYSITSALLHPFRGNPAAWFGGLRNPKVNSIEWPQLMLYSNGDRLVNATQVEEFAKLRSSQGATVDGHQFPDDSCHVQHYRSRPADYEKVLTEWLKERLNWVND